MKNKLNLEEDESILDSIDASADDNSDYESIIRDDPENIQDGNYVHSNNNGGNEILKYVTVLDNQKTEWKVARLSEKKMGNFFH